MVDMTLQDQYMFDKFHWGRLDVQRLNYGIITLLPKINEANKIQQFHHIFLLRCLYKWIREKHKFYEVATDVRFGHELE
jgi:hypothetical protein